MDRRSFIVQGSLITGGFALSKNVPGGIVNRDLPEEKNRLYQLFKEPPTESRPFVRWWWNGDKIEKEEIARELRLLKEAGIGGVEINPVQFPVITDDKGVQSVQWLSSQWIDLLSYTLTEANNIGLICDLIVGSGWPFGGEYLTGEQRSQVVVIVAQNIAGPVDYEVPRNMLFEEADPDITSPYDGRTMDILSLKLAPEHLDSMKEVRDLSDQVNEEIIQCRVPEGNHVLYALVRVNGFMEVINGAPGASGPVLNHFNKEAVGIYLNRMSDTIQKQIGPLSGKIRALFTDSMELEGANWCADMEEEFRRRRGYDLLPYLPFILYKTGHQGNITRFDYGSVQGTRFKDMIQRVRYDFNLTVSELFRERFVNTFLDWCRSNQVKSRMQAYGRGYDPLEGSFGVDIPECETWIKYGLGKEMREDNYQMGRAYTMINKYVSSAAHLKDKRQVSCEELTNTDMVFNASLEILKIAADQSLLSGAKHPVFHGFNYSPEQAPFPGWVRYGTFINERNNWWPYFRHFTDYRSRLCALFQQMDMFADIAVLNPIVDMWSIYSAQNEPFPGLIYPSWQTLVWETIHQNGNACDYVSENIIKESEIKNGYLIYGKRKYHTLFLIMVQSMEPSTAGKLYDFVSSGGKIICLNTIPRRSGGLLDHEKKDQQVRSWVAKMNAFKNNFIKAVVPERNYITWYQNIQKRHHIMPYVKIDRPEKFVSQIRYQDETTEALFFINSHQSRFFESLVTLSETITAGRNGWIWDPVTGNREPLPVGESGSFTLMLGPAESKLIVFDQNKGEYRQEPVQDQKTQKQFISGWNVTFDHINGTVQNKTMKELKDLKFIPGLADFSGTITYKTRLNIKQAEAFSFLYLGKVWGIAEVKINQKDCGLCWFGSRQYPVKDCLVNGDNTIEVKVVTTMGNYLKTLTTNPVAQYWTNLGRKDQPDQPMGMTGPVYMA